jgi:signal transduction histidine kinase
LGTLVASVELLERRLPRPDPQIAGELARIRRNVWRCVRIIEDLLAFSRKSAPALAPLAVDPWVAQQLAGQALVNLIQNAVQAVEARQPPEGGEVTVSTVVAGEELVLAVVDNGCGMPAEVRARMFEPLFSTKAFGVGLGMPLVQRIVEQHGGRVTVESEPGAGTRVALHLPRYAAESRHAGQRQD